MFMAFTEDCRKSSNATDADMNEILEGNVPTSQGAKCTITCVMKQFKIVSNLTKISKIKSRKEIFRFLIVFHLYLAQVNENEGKLELAVDTIVKLSEANGADSKKVDLIRTVAEKCKSPAVTDE